MLYNIDSLYCIAKFTTKNNRILYQFFAESGENTWYGIEVLIRS